MKRIIFVAICIIGFTCFSSCRSTSKSCGLSETITNPTTVSQINLI